MACASQPTIPSASQSWANSAFDRGAACLWRIDYLAPRFEKRFSKEPLEVWAIRVWEEQTPAGEEPLEWILVTSVPTTTLEQGCRARGMV